MTSLSRVIVDGMDGAGKSTLVAALAERGFAVQDRGNATHMVDDDALEAEPDAFYLILIAPVDACRARLAAAGKPLDEPWHTVESLTHYRRRYPEIRRRLPRSAYIETLGTADDALNAAVAALAAAGIRPVPDEVAS